MTSGTGKTRGSPRVFARVADPGLYARIMELREEYRTPDGKLARTSDVLLAFLSDGLPLMDREIRARARRLAKGEAMRDTWARVIRAGLDALERDR